MTIYPLLFEPNLHTTIWGGRKLQPYKGLESTDEPIGESCEVSAVPTRVSIFSNGIWKVRDLVSLIPASIADYDVIPVNGKSRLLEIYIDNHDKNVSTLLSN